ncbi:hypothetical protein [Jeotgalibaca ciconiae]|uniref:Uncharacterized protein n=1 Tax=Jeotgalibaca ciconiae TaxID=2496265 RepID=A0A3Q9BL48_9LACT|nr:hypothetical protein [Jeotgalibaca ciconiae]AZP03522.1 hypothetical protein EJN90_01885 [Jeotgalibaca ciconiae]HJB23194.1 hypothetical protein [Candidatus Jeotgalibaca pullicola]
MDDAQVFLLLTDTGSLLTQTIKLFTKKKYNHCSLALDSDLENTYSFGRKKINNPFIGGFVKEDTLSPFFLHSHCAIYSLTVSQKEKRELEIFIESMERDEHLFHYNFLGLITAFLEIEWSRSNYYFCSQFVATIMKNAGIFYPKKALSLVTPTDILSGLPFELIYEGRLIDYHQSFCSHSSWELTPSILD